MVYWDPELEKAQWWHYTDGEKVEIIVEDLKKLKAQGVIAVSVTSDGSPGIRQAVEQVYPDIPHQRCVIHLRRLALAWITQNPRTLAGWQIL